MADLHELKQMLLNRLEEVCNTLLPGGKLVGNYWKCGSIGGEAGESFRVNMASGAKRGVWIEGERGEGGDVIDLWCKKHGFARAGEAMDSIHQFLGLPREQRTPKHHKEYKPVDPSETKPLAPNGAVWDYLVETRKIPVAIIKDFGIAEKNWKRKDTIAFKYVNDSGETCLIKFCDVERNEKGKKVISTTADSKAILFGMFTKLVRNSKGVLLITEGEIDAMTWQAAGVPAVSVPFGAKRENEDGTSANDEWIDNCWHWLEQFHTIYVAMDDDEEGRAAAAIIIKRLGVARCKMVTLPHKDANECITEHGMEFAQLTDSLKTAVMVNPKDIKIGSELAEETWLRLREGPRAMQGDLPFDWPMKIGHQFRIRPREWTVVTGFNGNGKSNFLYQLMAWLAVVKHQKIFIGSYEEPADVILAIMCVHVLGRQFGPNEYKLFTQIRDALLENIIIHDVEESVKVDDFIELATYTAKRYGVSHIVMDSASTTDLNLDKVDEVADFSKKMQTLPKKTNAHLWTVCHPRKGANLEIPPSKMDVKGGGSLTDLCFNNMIIHRLRDTEHTVQWIGDKQKVGGNEWDEHLYFDKNSCRLTWEVGEIVDCWLPEININS